jgi:hypothetical protein
MLLSQVEFSDCYRVTLLKIKLSPANKFGFSLFSWMHPKTCVFNPFWVTTKSGVEGLGDAHT